MKDLKLVIIGGGSSYTPELIDGVILHRETLPVKEIVLIDIPAGKEKVEINTAFVKRMLSKAGMDIQVSYTFDRMKGLAGADFVITQLRVGGLEARNQDERIPLKYGLVGQETTGAGGCFKALRTIPVLLDICADMEKVCKDAWLINFTNPAGIVTEAVNKYTKVKCIGLCNCPINMCHDAAERLGESVAEGDLDCRFVGLNHLSIMPHVYLKENADIPGMEHGHDYIEEVLKVRKAEGVVKNINKIAGMDEKAAAMGAMLSPYMQYFYFTNEMVKEEQESVAVGKGTRANQVQAVEKALFEKYRDTNLEEKPAELSKRGGSRYSEAAINLVNSIFNNACDIQTVDTLNGNIIPELPADAVIETNCIISSKGATPIAITEDRADIRECYQAQQAEFMQLVKKIKEYERLTIEAAVHGDKELAVQALTTNPLIGNRETAVQVFEELYEAHEAHLTRFVH